MLGVSAFYGLILYLINAVIDDDSGQHFLPEHEFIVERQKFPKRGTDPKYHVTLIIGPYIFTRNKKAKRIGKNAVFICNKCIKNGKRTAAIATQISENDNPNDYVLKSCEVEHTCIPSSIQPLRKKFVDTLYSEVKKNPTKSIGKIYLETRTELAKDLTDDERMQFFEIIPNQASVTPRLTTYKNEFIPQQPKDTSDFDAKCPWLNLDSGESTVKSDLSIDDSRIILFAINYTLRLLARSTAISCDGTFKVCPKLWFQLFIVCGEISDGLWLPLAFGFLPNKKKETYKSFFTQLKDALSRIDDGLELSAQYVMIDFEYSIRSAFKETWDYIPLKGKAFCLLLQQTCVACDQ